VPGADLARLGCSAIFAFAVLTEDQGIIEHNIAHDEDIPF
jgi:hypothetical protein